MNTAVQQATQEPMGHEVRLASTISFNSGTLQFTIAPDTPTYTDYNVWVAGTPFTISSTQTTTIGSSTGLYYIFFDTTGNVGNQFNTFFVWDAQAPTAYVYYNSAHPTEYMFFDERHGITMDWATHEYLHRTRGAAIANGFDISGFTIVGTGNLLSDVQYALSEGTFFDEDLQVDVVDSTTGGTGVWAMPLTPQVSGPVIFRDASGWRKVDDGNNAPLHHSGANTLPYYNPSGTLAVPPPNNYVIMWIAATNMVTTPVIAIMGQGTYPNLGAAQNEVWSNLDLTGLPIVELRPLYRLIFETKNTFSNTYKSALRDVQDIRSFPPQIGIGAPTKTFVIDHPVRPEHYLIHACLEGPEAGVYYRGKATIEEGAEYVEIVLPDYVPHLAYDFTVHVTPVYDGRKKDAYCITDVVSNRFRIYGETGRVHWMVHGKRADIAVERSKDSVALHGSGPYQWVV
jgi:hypothetical protein